MSWTFFSTFNNSILSDQVKGQWAVVSCLLTKSEYNSHNSMLYSRAKTLTVSQ